MRGRIRVLFDQSRAAVVEARDSGGGMWKRRPIKQRPITIKRQDIKGLRKEGKSDRFKHGGGTV